MKTEIAYFTFDREGRSQSKRKVVDSAKLEAELRRLTAKGYEIYGTRQEGT